MKIILNNIQKTVKKIPVYIIFFLITGTSFSQIEDILKKIPGIKDVFEEAVTTSVKDAFPKALWLSSLDKKTSSQTGKLFSEDLEPGYYKFRFNTFCLRLGTYAPVEGSGYLIAPLKGSKAKLIKNILSRYSDHPEIDQNDVQLLIWGIEAGQKFSHYKPDFQWRVQPLLTPEEIAMMEVDINEVANDLLPSEIKEILNLYSDIRDKLSDVNASYEEVERLAVKTGIAPEGKGSIKFEYGTWSSIGNGAYMRYFPNGYKKADIEIYVPEKVTITKDKNGRITALVNDTYNVEFQYDGGNSSYKSAEFKNKISNETRIIDNNYISSQIEIDDFVKSVKKSFGKKKSKRIAGSSLKTLSQLKNIELNFSSLMVSETLKQDEYSISLNALNSFISNLESSDKEGGSRNTWIDFYGLVFTPANTAQQRTGNGGPEGGKDKCIPVVTLHRINPDYLPEPQTFFEVKIDIKKNEECNVEAVRYTLFNVSSEMGRCINEDKQEWYDRRLDFYFNQERNQSLDVSEDSLSGESFGEITTAYVSCNDFGAIGKIKVEVKIKGKWYLAKDEISNSYYINLPEDNDGNGIADFWEKNNHVPGLPSTWDEDPEPSGQARNGDGLTNYEEYRGCNIYDEIDGIKHIRNNPKLKEVFVIDSSNVFVSTSWEKASGLKAYYLTKELVFGTRSGVNEDFHEFRRVNFCSSFSKGNKFAINIKNITTLTDPYGIDTSKTIWGSSPLGPPRDVTRVMVFTERRRVNTIFIADSLDAILKAYPSQQLFIIDAKTFKRSQIEKFVNVCKDTNKLNLLVEFLVNRTVIHEVGHACAVNHHSVIDGGEKDCPMKYVDRGNVVSFSRTLTDLFEIIDNGYYTIVIYLNWKFCKVDDNCWKQLNVNDN